MVLQTRKNCFPEGQIMFPVLLPSWVGRRIKSDFWFHTGWPKIQAICLRALSKYFLFSGRLVLWLLPWRASSSASLLLPFRPFTLFTALLWIFSNSLMSFFYCGEQNCTQSSGWSCTARSRKDNSPCPVAVLDLTHPWVQLGVGAAKAHCWLRLNLPSEPWDPFPWVCNPAYHAPYCTYLQGYTVPSTEFSTWLY